MVWNRPLVQEQIDNNLSRETVINYKDLKKKKKKHVPVFILRLGQSKIQMDQNRF